MSQGSMKREYGIPVPALDSERRATVLRAGYADAVAGLRYIEQRYGRLEGVGWDRVFDHFDLTVTIPERESLPAGFCDDPRIDANGNWKTSFGDVG